MADLTRAEANCLGALAAKDGYASDADPFSDFWNDELTALDRKGLASFGGGWGSGWYVTRSGAEWLAKRPEAPPARWAAGIAVCRANDPHEET